MNAQHTSGPWHFAEKPSDDETCPEFVILQGTGYIATVDSSRSENTANARVIAAAPEMLEALYQYVSDLRYPPTGDSIQRRIERAEAVIAKVTAA